MQEERNYSLDVLKLICAVLVVLIHIDSVYYPYVLPLTRCAVPCFFMISGYLLYEEKGMSKRLKSSLKHVFFIFCWSTLLFAIIKLSLTFFLHPSGILLPTGCSIINFILFNENPWAGHLWYISAYIYVLMIMLVVERWHIRKILYFVVPLLLLTDLAFGKYSKVLWQQEFDYLYVRNFMFVGLPYFLIGMLIKRNLEKMLEIKNKYYLGAIVVFAGLSYLEYFILMTFQMNTSRDHYLSTTFLSIGLFMFFLQFKMKKPNLLSKVGKNDTLYIYIFHPLILEFFYVFNRIISFKWYSDIYLYISPFLIITGTYLFICGLRWVRIIK